VYLSAAGDTRRFLTNDSSDYVTLAYDLRAGYMNPNSPMFAMGLLRTPAYPVFLAASLRPFEGSLHVPVAVQIAVGTLTVWLTILLAARLVGPRASIWAGLVLAVDPVSALYPCLLLPETLFTALLAGGVLAWLHALERNSSWWSCAAGLLLGVAALTRPIGVFVPVLVAGSALLRRRQGVRAILAIVMFFGASIPAVAWVAKNRLLTGSAVFTIIGDSSLLDYRAAGALAMDEGIPIEQARGRLWARFWSTAKPGMDVLELSRRQRSLALEVLSEHKAAALWTWVDGVVRLFAETGLAVVRSLTGLSAPGTESAPNRAALFIMALALALGYAATGRGVFVLLRQGQFFELVLTLGLIAYLVALSAGPEAYSRFRLPAMPFIAILAGHGLAYRRIH
jgi:4-amino-4-deoxy-L-arabinose transferase-like glycosyltransferase